LSDHIRYARKALIEQVVHKYALTVGKMCYAGCILRLGTVKVD